MRILKKLGQTLSDSKFRKAKRLMVAGSKLKVRRKEEFNAEMPRLSRGKLRARRFHRESWVAGTRWRLTITICVTTYANKLSGLNEDRVMRRVARTQPTMLPALQPAGAAMMRVDCAKEGRSIVQRRAPCRAGWRGAGQVLKSVSPAWTGTAVALPSECLRKMWLPRVRSMIKPALSRARTTALPLTRGRRVIRRFAGCRRAQGKRPRYFRLRGKAGLLRERAS